MSQNILQEMASSLRSSKAQLEVVNMQLSRLERQQKLASVTAKELESYPVENVWRSCGKMFMFQDKAKYVTELSQDEKSVEEQIKAMKIKQHYLQTTVDNTVESLRRVVQQ
ncbi:LAMI_0G08108g1_1 [Lachancea mirantina]|uniref:LAMI_0G08108g1_1 n=1 Tax=Lachancea mirantina TaxID=1230905 RepID=A0A1G4K9U9_9SACH|nr:LAMI_0G08108g1_1 [Lachancea mirantina]